MRVYLGKDWKYATGTMTATHATWTGLPSTIKNGGHKLYTCNFFSSPDLFDDLHSKTINCCGTVKIKRTSNRSLEKDKLKWGDIKPMVKCNLTATIWKEKRDINKLTNMHHPPAEGNFGDVHGNIIKPVTIQDYNKHMGHVDRNYHMTKSYSISRWTEIDEETVFSPPVHDNTKQL
jgi:hypothetical protein